MSEPQQLFYVSLLYECKPYMYPVRSSLHYEQKQKYITEKYLQEINSNASEWLKRSMKYLEHSIFTFVLSDLPERPHGFSMHLKYKFLKALYLNTNL